MSKRSVTAISKSGIADITAELSAAEAAGDSVDAASGIFIAVANGDASSHTLTVTKPKSSFTTGNYGSLDITDITLEVAAGETGFVSIPPGFADSDGDFTWTYDDVTSVTIGVFSIAP